jgi:hypothetical protein
MICRGKIIIVGAERNFFLICLLPGSTHKHEKPIQCTHPEGFGRFGLPRSLPIQPSPASTQNQIAPPPPLSPAAQPKPAAGI